jgi:hypothetical protein
MVRTTRCAQGFELGEGLRDKAELESRCPVVRAATQLAHHEKLYRIVSARPRGLFSRPNGSSSRPQREAVAPQGRTSPLSPEALLWRRGRSLHHEFSRRAGSVVERSQEEVRLCCRRSTKCRPGLWSGPQGGQVDHFAREPIDQLDSYRNRARAAPARCFALRLMAGILARRGTVYPGNRRRKTRKFCTIQS